MRKRRLSPVIILSAALFSAALLGSCPAPGSGDSITIGFTLPSYADAGMSPVATGGAKYLPPSATAIQVSATGAGYSYSNAIAATPGLNQVVIPRVPMGLAVTVTISIYDGATLICSGTVQARTGEAVPALLLAPNLGTSTVNGSITGPGDVAGPIGIGAGKHFFVDVDCSLSSGGVYLFAADPSSSDGPYQARLEGFTAGGQALAAVASDPDEGWAAYQLPAGSSRIVLALAGPLRQLTDLRIRAYRVFFVDTDAGNDIDNGSLDYPVRTVAAASQLIASSEPAAILVRGNASLGATVLSPAASAFIRLHGGFSPASWAVRDVAAHRTRFIAPDGSAVALTFDPAYPPPLGAYISGIGVSFAPLINSSSTTYGLDLGFPTSVPNPVTLNDCVIEGWSSDVFYDPQTVAMSIMNAGVYVLSSRIVGGRSHVSASGNVMTYGISMGTGSSLWLRDSVVWGGYADGGNSTSTASAIGIMSSSAGAVSLIRSVVVGGAAGCISAGSSYARGIYVTDGLVSAASSLIVGGYSNGGSSNGVYAINYGGTNNNYFVKLYGSTIIDGMLASTASPTVSCLSVSSIPLPQSLIAECLFVSAGGEAWRTTLIGGSLPTLAENCFVRGTGANLRNNAALLPAPLAGTEDVELTAAAAPGAIFRALDLSQTSLSGWLAANDLRLASSAGDFDSAVLPPAAAAYAGASIVADSATCPDIGYYLSGEKRGATSWWRGAYPYAP